MTHIVTLEQLALAERQILRMYANSHNMQDQLFAACNPNTPADALIKLAGGEDRMRQAVLENPSCPTLVKVYFVSDRYGGMSLEEFLEAMG